MALSFSRARAVPRQASRQGSGGRRRLVGLVALAAGCALAATGAALPLRCFVGGQVSGRWPSRTSALTLQAAPSEAEIREEVNKLRAREIKHELEALGVGAADAFEKDELAERLVQARLRGDTPVEEKAAEPVAEPAGAAASPAPSPPEPVAATAAPDAAAGGSAGASQEILERCRAMRVTELRSELGSRGISWADALEKEELVQRLAGVLAEEASFSKTARLRPGAVGELSGMELMQELEPSNTPLLLDVYATWCGPCQMMAPHLEAAAKTLGARVRVAKMDSDMEPDMATELRVGGLPTIIVFDRNGQEVARQEGALMEQQLVQLVESAGL